MKKMIHKGLSLLLVLVMVVGMVPSTVFATTTVPSGFKWSTGYTLTAASGSGAAAQRYLKLSGSPDTPTFKLADYFDYVVETKYADKDGSGNPINTACYTQTATGESFRLTEIMKAKNTDSYIALKLYPKKNANISVTLAYDDKGQTNDELTCYYHFTKENGGADQVLIGETTGKVTNAITFNKDFQLYKDNGYIEVKLHSHLSTGDNCALDATFTINSISEIKDAYTVKAAAEKADRGTVKVVKSTTASGTSFGSTDVNGQEVARNYNVQFTATAAANCTFAGWYDKNGTLVSDANPYQVQVATGDIDLVARFTKNVSVRFGFPTRLNDGRYTVGAYNVYKGTGKISANKLTDITGSVLEKTWQGNSDQQFLLVAQSPSDHWFVGWYAGSNDLQFILAGDIGSDATKRAEYRKKVNAWYKNAELISSEREFVFNAEEYDGKTIAPLFIIPETSVTATFVPPAEGGSITVSQWNDDASAMVTHAVTNSEVTVTTPNYLNSLASDKSKVLDTRWVATPQAGWNFMGWYDLTTGKYLLGDSDVTRVLLCMGEITQSSDTTVAFAKVSGHKITAVFEQEGQIYRDFEAVTGGSYTVNGTAVPAAGLRAHTPASGSFALKATPDALYSFAGWVDASGTVVSTANPYNLPAGSAAVKPQFAKTGIKVTLGTATNGSYTVTGDGKTFTVGQQVEVNKTVEYTMTATPANGYTLYYWEKDGQRWTESNPYIGTLPEGATLRPVFVKADAARYSANGEVYAYLNEALAAVANAENKTITVVGSGKVYSSDSTTNLTIPKGVTLLVPHENGATVGKNTKMPYACVTNSHDVSDKVQPAVVGQDVFVKLTVPSGTTINVLGIVSVGGALTGTGMITRYAEMIVGTDASTGNPVKEYKTFTHGEIEALSGAKITASNGGIISSCGFIHGAGTVEVNSSGALFVPFAVNDFKYGGYTVGVASKIAGDTGVTINPQINHPSGEEAIMPFSRYSVTAVQATQVIRYGGVVMAYVDLYAGGDHNYSMIKLIQKDTVDDSLIRLGEGATATIKYTGGNQLKGVGRTKITLDGKTEFGYVSISINAQGVVSATINSGMVNFPIPYNFDVLVNSGSLTVTKPVELLPGATLTVNKGATLNANANLTVYDALHDYTSTGRNMSSTETGGANTGNKHVVLSGYQNQKDVNGNTPATSFTASSVTPRAYPTTAQLTAAGLSGAAQLIVNGTLNLNAAFGGIVQTTGTTGVIKANHATLSTTTQIGGVGYWYTHVTGKYEFSYELVGATVRTLKAQILDANGNRVNIVKGKTYKASGSATKNVASTEYKLYFADKYNDSYYTVIPAGEVSVAHSGSWTVDCGGNHTYDNNCDTTCNACGQTRTTTHTWDSGKQTTAPTCTATGVKTITCTVCGTTKTETIAAKGHTEVIDKAVAATCTTAGKTEGKHCSVCNTVIVAQTEVAALGHKDENHDHICDNKDCQVSQGTCADADKDHDCDYGCEREYGEHVDSNKDHACDYGCQEIFGTCTDSTDDNDHVCDYGCNKVLEECSDKSGDKDHKCDVCGEENVTDHDYSEATCTAPKACTECGTTEGEALGHTEATREENRVEATCGQAGSYNLVTYCSVCNTVIKTEKETIPATNNHKYTWATTTEATCVAKGVETGTCTCGETTTRDIEIDSNAHNLVTVSAQTATCTQVGWNDYQYCDREGCEFTTYVEIPMLEHVFAEEWSSDETGHWHKCNNCTATTEVEAHNEESVAGYAATCTEPGLTDGVKCSVCQEVLTAQEEIEALGHKAELVPAKAATCTEAGNIAYWHCTECGKYFSDEACETEIVEDSWIIPATGEHNYENGICKDCGTEEPADPNTPVPTTNTSQYGYQVGLIEPWFLRINTLVRDANGNVIDPASFTDYGAYAIRKSLLANADSVIADADYEAIIKIATAYTKGTEASVHEADNRAVFRANVDGTMALSFRYRENIYTYEMDDPIVFFVWYVDDTGLHYTTIREQSIMARVKKNMTNTKFDDDERAVYVKMSELYDNLVAHRSTGVSDLEKIDPVAASKSKFETCNGTNVYTFKQGQQIVLVEPWGVRINAFAQKDGKTIDYSTLDDYGIVFYHAKGNTAPTSVEEVLKHQNEAYVFSKEHKNISTGVVDGMSVFYARYRNEIYTYELDSTLSYFTYIVVDGEYYYSQVWNKNIKEMAASRAESTKYGATERAVYRSMVELCETVVAYRSDD